MRTLVSVIFRSLSLPFVAVWWLVVLPICTVAWLAIVPFLLLWLGWRFFWTAVTADQHIAEYTPPLMRLFLDFTFFVSRLWLAPIRFFRWVLEPKQTP